MTGEEMPNNVEEKAVELGREQGFEEASRRMLRIVFERRFGPV